MGLLKQITSAARRKDWSSVAYFDTEVVPPWEIEGALLTLSPTLYEPVFVETLGSGSTVSWIYYTEDTNDTIRKVDWEGNNDQLVVDCGTTKGVRGLAIDQINSKLYVCCYTSNEIMRCDLDGTNLTTIIDNATDGITGPTGVFTDPANSYIYFTTYSNGTLRADLNGDSVTTLVAGNTPSDLTTDGTLLYRTCGTGTDHVRTCTLAGASDASLIAPGGSALGIEFGESGWFYYCLDTSIRRISDDGITQHVNWVTGTTIIRAAFDSEGGTHLFYTDQKTTSTEGGIWRVDVGGSTGSNKTQIFATTGTIYGIAVETTPIPAQRTFITFGTAFALTPTIYGPTYVEV